MMKRPLMWFALSLLCLAGAWFFWKWGDAAVARRRQGSPSAPAPQQAAPAVRATSTTVTPRSTAIPYLSASSPNRAATNTSPLAFRLSNTTRPYRELVREDHAVLLENAVVDTAQPAALAIPSHLRAAGEPGAYIVQSRQVLDDAFRAALKSAGATIISYIPNNAYLVRANATAAAQLAGNPRTQSVLPYEPYYKVRSTLLPLAVNEAVLPENARLNLVLFADAAQDTKQAVRDLGAQIIAEDRSPFGPVLRVHPRADSLVALAGLSGVQTVELAHERVRANDLSRVRIGVATNTLITTSNYLNLTGEGILVSVTDEGIDSGHPDLVNRVTGDIPRSLQDFSGHGTHVATTIAGSGASSTTVLSPPSGSVTNADFRGRAPLAEIFSTLYIGTNAPNTPFLPDGYLQETVARTTAYVANNSWGYGGDNTYSIAAASYDWAVRDAQPEVTGARPLVYVFSAGNGGAGPEVGFAGDAGSIHSPGTAKNVITVGALEQSRNITNYFLANCITNTITQTNAGVVTNITTIECETNRPFLGGTDSETQVASYSSRGNVGIGVEGDFGRFKPDVVAPGNMVVSGRSRQWDEAAYYDPTSVTENTLREIVIEEGSNFLNQIFIPENAIQVRIRVFPNAASPTPFPPMPIFVRQAAPPSGASPVATNVFTMPGNLPLTPIGTTWYYRVVNVSTQEVSLDIVTTITTLDDSGRAKEVLKELNAALAPNYRFESGTSMAAAEVSGTLALMQQFFERGLSANVNVSPALLKASLINGARAAGPTYDFQVDNTVNLQGWGAINLESSLPPGVTNGIPHGSTPRGVASVQFFDQSPLSALATGQSQTRKFEISPDGTFLPLRVTLVWTDPPGNPAAGIKLVNDLDLVVTNLDTGDVYFGNRFFPGSNFVSPWDTNEVALIDVVNNVENVYIAPDLGTNYSVTVRAKRVNVNAVSGHTDNTVQDYALIVSCGAGEAADALTLKQEEVRVGSVTPVTLVTNTFESPTASGFLLGNQLVGANTPLLGTTNGMTNQWHFYIVTNTTTFTNAAFITFLPPTLAMPRMGVRERDEDNATRVQADIDLYVSQDPRLLVLDETIINAAFKSTGRTGTEQVIFSNSFQNALYFIGVKSEDQMAAEYAFFGVFSLLPFDSESGPPCIITSPIIPDRSPANVSRLSDVATVICPCALEGQARRVVITNVLTHENLGDVLGNVAHNSKFAALNNHRPAPPTPIPPGPYGFIYEDNQEYTPPVPGFQNLNSDGPGSLRDFVGEERTGPWIFTFLDDALTQTGLVNQVNLLIEKQDITGENDRFIAPNSFLFDFVDVPGDATNLEVCVSGNTAPLELYMSLGAFPSVNDHDYFYTVLPPGGCLNVTPQDLPPLVAGRYFIGVFNPNSSGQTIRLVVTITRSPGTDNSLKFTSATEIPIIDDGVTYASMFNGTFARVGDVKVGLRIDHPRVSDLAITLISPQGTRVLLSENRARTNTMGFGSSFGITNTYPVTRAGGAVTETNIIDTGLTEGFLTIDYNFICVPDRMTIYYDGARIFDSGFINNGCPTGPDQQFVVNFGPGFSTEVMIVMNEGGDQTRTTAWSYTASAIQLVHNYLIFTEDLELTTTPIKFGQPPFTTVFGSSNYLFSTFDTSTVGFYPPPNIVDGWDVNTNTTVQVFNDPALVNAGSNSLAMHTGALQRSLPTKKGKSYGLSYAFRRNSLFDGLVSWWPAEDNLEDIVDGNDGAAPALVTFTNGMVGKTFVFDGDRDGIYVGTNANLHLQDFSIEAWIKRTSASTLSFNGNGNSTLFAVGTGGGGYGFYIRADGQLAIGKSQVNEVVAGALISDTNWHHVAVTKVGTAVVFYRDGVAFPAAPYVSGGYTFAAPAVIGAWENPSLLLDNTFYGAIDELSVYNRALTQTEISLIVAAGSAGKCVPSLPPVIRPDNSAALGFATNSNPSGVWTYGYSTNLGGSLIPFIESGSDGQFEYWRTNIFQGAPNVIHNPSGAPVTSGTITLGANQLALLPGPIGEFSVIRYTCPTNDNYQLVAAFSGVDTTGTTTDVHILSNGVSIFAGLVNGYGLGPSLSTNLNLNTGDLIEFVVGWGTNLQSTADTTGLSAVIVPTTGCETSPTFVSVLNTTNQIKGTPVWQTNSLVFVATSNSTPVNVFAEGGESDVLMDSFSLLEPPDGLYFLPDESLKALEGEIAFGNWRLEIWDTRVGAAVPEPRLLSWQLDFVYQQILAQPGRIPPGSCNTAVVPAGQIRYYAIDVPSYVRAVTNRLTAASGRVNVLFNQSIPPTGTNSVPPDYMLITNSTFDSYTLTTNISIAPVLQPGQRYFLGVHNPGTNAVIYTLCIDFDLSEFPPFVSLTNGVPFCTVNPGPSEPMDYYRFVVSTNAKRAQFELTALSDDMTLVLRQGLPPNSTLDVFDYFSANPYTNDEVITVFDFSKPVPLTPGDWFFAAVNLTANPVSYCATATEWPVYGTDIVIVNYAIISNALCLTWTSLPGVPYHVEGKVSLSDTNWVIASPTVRGTGPLTTYCIPLPTPLHFFRVAEGIVINPFVPPPKFTSITRVPTGYLLLWSGPTNQLYELQWTTNITPPSLWGTFAPPISSTSGRFGFLDDGSQTGGLSSLRFYRLKLFP